MVEPSGARLTPRGLARDAIRHALRVHARRFGTAGASSVSGGTRERAAGLHAHPANDPDIERVHAQASGVRAAKSFAASSCYGILEVSLIAGPSTTNVPKPW